MKHPSKLISQVIIITSCPFSNLNLAFDVMGRDEFGILCWFLFLVFFFLGKELCNNPCFSGTRNFLMINLHLKIEFISKFLNSLFISFLFNCFCPRDFS